ncbi:hypothetical protein MTO96_035433 [Rhipicephalus appendiculatus]
MSMQVSVEGEDISPKEFQSAGWSTASNRRKSRAKPTSLYVDSSTPSDNGMASPHQSRTTVKKKVIAASRLPHMPRDHFRVVVRPRNGLIMRNVSQIKFAQALAKAAELTEEDVAEDVVCPNVMQNIAVISTPAERNAIAYSKDSHIFLGITKYEVSAYTAAPDDTCKGVIRGVDVDIGPAQLQSLIVHGRNPTALPAKRIKNSTTIVIPFDGLQVPNYVICGTAMFRCTLFRRQTDVCYICGWVGHRADVCPHPEKVTTLSLAIQHHSPVTTLSLVIQHHSQVTMLSLAIQHHSPVTTLSLSIQHHSQVMTLSLAIQHHPPGDLRYKSYARELLLINFHKRDS